MRGYLELLLLDRDGVINQKPKDGTYILKESELLIDSRLTMLLNRILEILPIAVITNQQCIGKGLISMQSVENLHSKIAYMISSNKIDKMSFFVCPHLKSDNCLCRKPKPGLLLRALDFYGVQPEHALFIGDQVTDRYAALAAKVPFIFASTPSESLEILSAIYQELS